MIISGLGPDRVHLGREVIPNIERPGIALGYPAIVPDKIHPPVHLFPRMQMLRRRIQPRGMCPYPAFLIRLFCQRCVGGLLHGFECFGAVREVQALLFYVGGRAAPVYHTHRRDRDSHLRTRRMRTTQTIIKRPQCPLRQFLSVFVQLCDTPVLDRTGFHPLDLQRRFRRLDRFDGSGCYGLFVDTEVDVVGRDIAKAWLPRQRRIIFRQFTADGRLGFKRIAHPQRLADLKEVHRVIVDVHFADIAHKIHRRTR